MVTRSAALMVGLHRWAGIAWAGAWESGLKYFFVHFAFIQAYLHRILPSRLGCAGLEAVQDVDTSAAENAADLAAMLLPRGRIPIDVRRFGIFVANAALQGWVRQSSPVCAAASTAGAWNAVHGLPRDAPGAHDQHSVLAVMRSLLQEKIDGRRARLERRWLQAP
eukprot:EG_transcript_36670